MADAPTTGEAVPPPELPTTLAEKLHELHFQGEGPSREVSFEELCSEHPHWAATMREYRAAIALGEEVIGRASNGIEEAQLPERIGPFQVLELLGEGGFGVVYRAEQREPVQRIVALKVLRRGRIDERSRLRFEAERHTLARMQHAGIAQVFDAGQTAEGQLYLAMEFVDGLPLTTWCDRKHLDIAGRLGLFLRICGAVQHAHQRGVVHRDLKPSNVLVWEEDGRAVAKVIDFGVAKLLLEDELGDALATREGALIGTPGYMSPEQATGIPVDTRTDVYALGVLLYELLAGDLPFSRQRLSTGNVAEVVRILCEEDPQRLSTAVRQATDAPDLIAERRGCKLDTLLRTLRGDLQWVVRKALAKDPDLRYASVSALIRDVECYQRNQPVSAREPAALYVLRKFATRHRLGVGIGLAVVAVTALVVVGLVWALNEVEGARQLAVDRGRIADENRAAAVLNEYSAHLAAAQPALQVGRVDSARRHLLAAAPEHRGWEWRHLAALCDTSLATWKTELQAAHVFWLGDGDRLLICYYRDGAEIRNALTGDVEDRIPFEGENNRALYDRKNQRLIAIIDWRTLLVWSAGDWDEPAAEFAFDSDVRSLALAPDGRALATSENSGAVRLLDLEGGREARILCHAGLYAQDLTFLAGGARVALALGSGELQLRDRETGAVVPTFNAQPAKYRALAAAGDTLFASGDGEVVALDSGTGEVLAKRSTRARIGRLCLSRDGRTLYGCGSWAAVELTAWDTSTLEVIGRYHGHRSGAIGLDVHPDGTRIATGSYDGTARVWSAAATPSVRRLDAGFDARQLSVSRDGRAFACADLNGRVTVWDAETLAEAGRYETGERLSGCVLGEDEVYVAGTRLLAIDRNSGQVREGDAPGVFARQLAIDAREQWLVGTNEIHGRLVVWQLPDMRLAHSLEFPAGPVEFDVERELFAVGGMDGVLRFVDAERGEIVATRPIAKRVFGLAIAESRLVVGAEQLHLIEGDRAHAPIAAHPIATLSVAFTPDGQRIATGGADALVRLWNLDGTELLVLEDGSMPIVHVKFAAEGRRLLALNHKWSTPTHVLVWDAPPQVTLRR